MWLSVKVTENMQPVVCDDVHIITSAVLTCVRVGTIQNLQHFYVKIWKKFLAMVLMSIILKWTRK